jgi:hypothetical protein
MASLDGQFAEMLHLDRPVILELLLPHPALIGE